MNHDDRVRRLNILLGTLPVQAEIDDTDAYLDQWESALVRAAAEISGLLSDIAMNASVKLDRELSATARSLRRYAKLAK